MLVFEQPGRILHLFKKCLMLQKFLRWSRRMLMDGAVHPCVVRAELKVFLAAEINLKCCFLATLIQWDTATNAHTQQVCPSYLLAKGLCCIHED